MSPGRCGLRIEIPSPQPEARSPLLSVPRSAVILHIRRSHASGQGVWFTRVGKPFHNTALVAAFLHARL